MYRKDCSFRLEGALGNAGKVVLNNYLKETSFARLVEIFRSRQEYDNGWRCEFWGKIIRGAILLNGFIGDPEMKTIIEKSVDDILSTRQQNGSISSYPEEKQLEGWNLWGIKYVLLGLLRYAQYEQDKERIAQACSGLLSYVEQLLEQNGKFFPCCGMHTGLAASSMLGAIVKVWDLTGDPHWKAVAEKLIASGCSTANNIFEEVEKGTLPSLIGNGKAYELTSCFQGLAEYITVAEKRKESYLQDRDYKKICLDYFKLVCDNEIMITGVSGLKDSVGEFWGEGKYKQHLSDAGSLGETCIMTTMLHYADAIMTLSGEKNFAAAELAETILYNALLGGMTPDGRNFTHANPTPLTGGGWKAPAGDQMQICFKSPFDGHDCCRAQGPEGLAMAYPLALRLLEQEGDNGKKICGCVVNLYEKMKAEFPDASLAIDGDYPYGGKAEIKVRSKDDFTVFLRIPHYTAKITLNGRELSCNRGEFLKVINPANEESCLEIFFDLSLKEVSAPGDPAYTAVKRGAVVLAEDSRKKDVPNARVHEEWNGHFLVEYSAAGSCFNKENTLQVFFRA